MHSYELKKLEIRLLEPIFVPVIGRCLQKKAVTALAEDNSPDAVKVLAKAIARLQDEEIKEIVLDALGKLNNQKFIDAFCQVWADTRHKDLTNLLVKKGWVASKPSEPWADSTPEKIRVLILTALKTKNYQIITDGEKEIVELLLYAFQDKDTEIANRASECAVLLKNLEAQEKFCRLFIEKDHQIAGQVAIEAQYAPQEPNNRALFYLLTDQWDKYESLDFNQALLQKAHELANESLRNRILSKLRQAGRVEWLKVIAGGNQKKQLATMTDDEWETTLEVLNNNQQWEAIWQLAQKAPAVWSKQLLQKLNQVTWIPTFEEERLVFDRLKLLAGKCSEKLLSMSRIKHCQAIVANPNDYKGIFGIGSVFFSPDCKLIASCQYKKPIKVWQISDGQLVSSIINDHTGHFTKLIFSPDGKILASVNTDKTIKLWQISDGQLLDTLPYHTNKDWISQFFSSSDSQEAFSPDGRLLASFSRDSKTLELWQIIPFRRLLATFTGRFITYVQTFSFSPDGQILAVRSSDKTIELWRMPDCQLLTTLPGTYFSFSPDGQILLTRENETRKLWRMPDGQFITTVTDSYLFISSDDSLSPDGQIRANFGGSNTIELQQVPDGKLLATLTGHTSRIKNKIFSPDGKILASYCYDHDKSIKLWQIPNGRLLATLTGHKDIDNVGFSSDGKILASCGSDEPIRLWSLDLLQLLMHLPISNLNQQDRKLIEKALQDNEITEENSHWLKFMEALMNWHWRFDVEVADATQLINVGEFDIEIEGQE